MTIQKFRRPSGGLIDRGREVEFDFAGKAYSGFAGDTLASALLANGVHMVARSFKYHRPRGILGAGPEDPAALVQLGNDAARTDPNMRATEIEIYSGLQARPQNVWPSLALDIGALNDLFWRFLPAGFYYKTFMGPPLNWMFFERFIRAAAGLGRAPEGPDPDVYETTNRHCDVLVIGGGASGLMAARAAAKSGARVILAEESARPGGWLLALDAETSSLDGRPPVAWVEEVERELSALANVELLSRTCGFGYYGENYVGLHQSLQDHLALSERDSRLPRQRMWRVRARQVILATGAHDRPLTFHGNDRPGIMLAGAVSTYIHRYGVMPGRRAVIFTNNSAGWQAAFDLYRTGAYVAAIIDLRADPGEALMRRAEEFAIPTLAGHAIIATKGRKRISSVTVRKLDGAGDIFGPDIKISCDLIAVSGGLSPNVALFSQSRGKLLYDEEKACFRPGLSWQREVSVGACNGVFSLREALREADEAGRAAAERAGHQGPAPDIPDVSGMFEEPYAVEPVWEVPSEKRKSDIRAFVDLQNDVQAKDLHLAVQEGYCSVEHAKRYTTTGMGSDQGKTVNVNAFGILSRVLGKSMVELGVTTYRQPYKPVTFGAITGQHTGKLFDPRRTTPMHDWHVERGAIFEPVGDWLRAQVYPKGGESFEEALQRESLAARTSLGVLDASTLGKIDIQGRDAREFLNRIYTNGWLKLTPGRCRYGLMLNEDGMVFDDGVTSCLDDDHFHMTTTTGGAATVLGWLEEYHQTEWPDLEVYFATVTEQWAVVSICGPNSARLMAELCDGLDPDPDRFKFMSWADAKIDGVPARIFRISFTGELSYEINVPASYGLWLWEKIFELQGRFDITPYGTEAMHLLRAEKGFIIVGQDTDGTVTPFDLRMDWAVKKNADFVGRRSLFRADTSREDRRQFVGLLTQDRETVLAEGAHVIETSSEPEPPVPMLGHVTSSYYSPNLKRSIALGLVASGGRRIGSTLYVTRPGTGEPPVPVKITEVDMLAECGGDR